MNLYLKTSSFLAVVQHVSSYGGGHTAEEQILVRGEFNFSTLSETTS